MTTEPTLRRTSAPRPARRRRVVTTALVLLSGALACGVLAAGLAARALALTRGSTAPTIDSIVELAVTGIGALVAGWLAASAVLASVCLAVRLVGPTWRYGERLVHRC